MYSKNRINPVLLKLILLSKNMLRGKLLKRARSVQQGKMLKVVGKHTIMELNNDENFELNTVTSLQEVKVNCATDSMKRKITPMGVSFLAKSTTCGQLEKAVPSRKTKEMASD